jgi:hypothetical protein
VKLGIKTYPPTMTYEPLGNQHQYQVEKGSTILADATWVPDLMPLIIGGSLGVPVTR